MKRQNCGVTLIELLMVILIIGIMTLISAPLILNFGTSLRLNHVARSLAAQLRLARNLAVTKSLQYSAVIYTRGATGSSTYTNRRNHILIFDSSGNQLEKPWVAPSLTEIPDVRDTTIADTIDGSGDNGTVSVLFGPSGGVSNSKEFSIHIIQKRTQINGADYNPGGTYTSSPWSNMKERVKCPTVMVGLSGKIRVHSYGIDRPWTDAATSEK